MRDRPNRPAVAGRCPDCGKMRFMTRRDAKLAARMNPGTHMAAYACGEYFHIGKLSPTISRGYSSRDNTREYPPSVTQWSERRLGVPPPMVPTDFQEFVALEAKETDPAIPAIPNPGMLRPRTPNIPKPGIPGEEIA